MLSKYKLFGRIEKFLILWLNRDDRFVFVYSSSLDSLCGGGSLIFHMLNAFTVTNQTTAQQSAGDALSVAGALK